MANTDGKPARESFGSSPADAERALKSAAAIRAVPPEVRRTALADLAAARQKLGQAVCSQPWFDDCWARGQPFPPPADTSPMVPCRCERCRRQGRVWPSHYQAPTTAADDVAAANAGTRERGANDEPPPPPTSAGSILAYDCYLESLDDWTAAQLPSSPSGLALRAIREGRIRLRRQRTRLGSPRQSGNG